MIFILFLPFVMAFLMRFGCGNQRKLAYDTLIFTGLIEMIAALLMIFNDRVGGNVYNIDIDYVGGLGLSFVHDGFRGIMVMLTGSAWFVISCYTKEFMTSNKKVVRYFFYNLLTLGSVLGIFYSADFFTLFFFFEIMSFASFMWVAHRETSEARYAAGTYLGISVAGGLAILMGIFLIYDMFGTLNFDSIKAISSREEFEVTTRLMVAAGCMFAGFGAKASAFPVHIWLPNAYTQAPSPASALLSAILSKTGIFGIVMITWNLVPGNSDWGMFLIIIGVITMIIGGIRAIFSDSIKTTVAYSSMSQIGFILFGIAMQAITLNVNDEAYNMALNGTLLHMFNHAVIKLVLFMITGIVFMNVGSYELNKVRGFGRNKPFLMISFLLGAAGLSGVPLLNGYISKTLLHESLVEFINITGKNQLFKNIEYLFLFSGGLTVCYMLKLFIILFVEKNKDEEIQRKYDAQSEYVGVYTKFGIGLSVFPILFIGLIPGYVTYKLTNYAYKNEFVAHYFTIKNLLGAVVSITIGLIVYGLFVKVVMFRKKNNVYKNIWPSWIDLEKYFYRFIFYRVLTTILGITSRIIDCVVDTIVVVLRKTVYKDLSLPYELPEGTIFTHSLGLSMERIRMIKCYISKTEYTKKDYEHKFALKRLDIVENVKIIERSLSFGLFMFCCGLVLTLVYLMIVN